MKKSKSSKSSSSKKTDATRPRRFSHDTMASLAILAIVFIVLLVTVVKLADKRYCPEATETDSIGSGNALTGNVIMPLSPDSVLQGTFCYDSDATYGEDTEFLIPGFIAEKAVSRELMKEYSDGNDVYLDSCKKNYDGSNSAILIEGTCINTIYGKALKPEKIDCRKLLGSRDAFCAEGEYGAYCSS